MNLDFTNWSTKKLKYLTYKAIGSDIKVPYGFVCMPANVFEIFITRNVQKMH